MSVCHLCFAVACDCGLTYFRVKMISTYSSVRFLLAFIFLNVCSASLRKCERKWSIFSASEISGCILVIVSKRTSNSSNFSFLPSQISLFIVVGFNSADDVWDCSCDAVPAIVSTSPLIGLPESEFFLCGDFPILPIGCQVKYELPCFVVG